MFGLFQFEYEVYTETYRPLFFFFLVDHLGQVFEHFAPRLETFPIGFDGVPVKLTVPDPRAFAVHKYYISKQRNRDPVKKQRDDLQAKIIVNIVNHYLPAYGFTRKALRNFPEKLHKEFLEISPSREEDRLW